MGVVGVGTHYIRIDQPRPGCGATQDGYPAPAKPWVNTDDDSRIRIGHGCHHRSSRVDGLALGEGFHYCVREIVVSKDFLHIIAIVEGVKDTHHLLGVLFILNGYLHGGKHGAIHL